MKKNLLLSILIILSLTLTTFAQLDSVYYQGPADGSVASGVMVTLNATIEAPINGHKIADRITENPYFDPNPSDLQPADFHGYVYVEDKPVNEVKRGTNAETVLLDKWDGVPMGNSIPPDPIIAVGPDHVIACANSNFRVWDKEGNLIAVINADTWISPVITSGAFDPQIIYDHYQDRWFMLWDWQDNASQQAWFIISYSDDADPMGTWYMYKMDAKVNGTINSGTWGDYPQIGYDDEAIYINSRSFTFGGNYQGNRIRILNKTVLYGSNGGNLPFVDIWSIGRPLVPSDKPDVLQPSICYTPGEGGYFFNTLTNGGAYYILYKMLNPISATPRLRGKTIVLSTFYNGAPNANQLGGGSPLLESGGSKCRHAPIVRDGFLYAAHSIANTTNSTYSSVKYNKIDITSATVVEQAELGSIGYYYLYPALAIDKDHNIAVTFSRSADTEYVGAFFSAKYAGDPPGLNPSVMIQEGLGNYVVTFGGTRNRWGDYMGIQLDPVNEYDVWTLTEYVKSQNQWGTYVGRLRMASYPGAYAYAESFDVDFGDNEIGNAPLTKTVTLTNYGDENLVITEINSPVTAFTLLTNLTLPLTILPYDSLDLEFEFDPTDPILYEDLMSFNNNDPNFPGFLLKGRGYVIKEAGSVYLYATSGSEATGKSLLVDKSTAVATELGATEYSSINTITADPVNNILYGVSSGNPESSFLRVNASGGDAHTLYNLDLSFVVAVACDTNGTVYIGLQNGEIYSIDISTGNYTFVTTANIQLVSLAVNPLTNEMWASPRVVIGQKDKIYTIDLTTGTATLVGETDFNVATNDLAFDENGVLYGVIGGETEEGQLITIDTGTALGTLVGEMGFDNVKGLAYAVNGVPLSADDNQNNSIPLEFALEQNYPNPFNPSTTIGYKIAEPGFVTLKVYDLLGNEVMTIVNEQKPTGSYKVEFDASTLTSGVYFYQLKSGNLIQTKKMVLLK